MNDFSPGAPQSGDASRPPEPHPGHQPDPGQPYPAQQPYPGQPPYGSPPYAGPPNAGPSNAGPPYPGAPYPGSQPGGPAKKKPFYRRRRFLVALAVLVALGVVGVVYGNQTSGYVLGSALKDALLKLPGVHTVDQVKCPSDVNTDKGHTYTCRAKVNGKQLNLHVTFDADRHFLVDGATSGGAPSAVPSATTSTSSASPVEGTSSGPEGKYACTQAGSTSTGSITFDSASHRYTPDSGAPGAYGVVSGSIAFVGGVLDKVVGTYDPATKAVTLTKGAVTLTCTASSGATPSAGSGAAPISVPIADASATRDALLAQAMGSAESGGTVTNWTADKALAFSGSAVAAGPSDVSGFTFVTDKAKNVDFLSFAVADTQGHCAGGVLLDNASFTKVISAKPVTLPAGAACTGSAVGQAAGYGG